MIPFNISNMSLRSTSIEEIQTSYANAEAERFFTREQFKSLGYRVGVFLTGRSRSIHQLHQEKRAKTIRTRHYEGIRTVPLKCIRGTENRNADFDRHFHPIRKHIKGRWIAIATEMLLGHPLPPVELIKFDDIYFVRDGHHRVSASQALGRGEIEANVITWISDGENERHTTIHE